jgi:putative PIN family toxin of toxin-antitoxin system
VRTVLDSNVLISAAITRGPAHRIVLQWLKSGPFELIICPTLIEEVATVLTERDHMRRWISIEDARLYLDRLRTTADVRDDPAPGPSLTRDPEDDFIVYLARENDADLIVSGDGDLLDWPQQQPPVMKPAEFERVLTQN